MRPLRLELEGFTSFADRTVVDFEDLQLFAITGPTGAGKSSLLDAMLLALFGRVPRVGRNHKQLVTDGRDQVAVMLEFLAGGARYRIARRIRLKGPSQVQLDRVLGETTEPVADRVADIDGALQRILGIGYDAFTRAVVLPQGQFDAFLRGEPAQRRELLEQLLGLGLYKRMGELAGRRMRDLEARAAAARDRLARDFAGADAENLAARQREQAEAEAGQQQLGRRAGTLAAAERAAQDLRRARADAAAAARALREAQQKLDAARENIAAERRAAAAFATDRAELERQLEAVPDPGPEPDLLARAAPLAARLGELHAQRPALEREAAAAAARIADIEQKLGEAEARLPELEAQVAATRSAADAAREHHDLSQLEHAAAHLRGRLRKGEPCPVCAQDVTRVPRARPTAVPAARKALQGAETAAREAERRLHELQTTCAATRESLPDLRAAQAAAARRCEEQARDGERLRSELREIAPDLAPGTTDGEPGDPDDRGSDGVAALQRAIEGRLRALRERGRERQRLQQRLGELLEADRQRATRLAAAEARLELLAPQVAQHGAAERDAQAAAARSSAALAEALRDSGVPAPAAPKRAGDPDEAEQLARHAAQVREELAAAGRRAGRLAEQVRQLEQAIAQATALRAELDGLQDSAAVARDLAQLLQGDRFQTFVQEEALHLLTEDGSARLHALSQGRYALRYADGDFAVVDHWNADRERSVRTLSGGETFLASLALSLGLAERIARLAAGDGAPATLECLFVDEGFGALDPESLEVAVQALEALHGGERMVGVVTHLPELAERLPARLTVINRAGRARVELS